MAIPLNVVTRTVQRDGHAEERIGVGISGLIVVDIEKIAQEVSDKCTVTRADVHAVMSELEEYVGDQLLQGKNIRMHALGSFRTTLRTEAAPSEKECSAANIRGVNIRYTMSGYLSRALALRRLKFEKCRALLIKQKQQGAGE